MSAKQLENLHVGDKFETGSKFLSGDAMKDFARTYDPQPIHLDEAAANDSLLGTLAGSGWHVLCESMRLIADAKPFGSTPLIGMVMERIRFHRPVLPETEIRCRGEILETRLSESRTDRGYVLMHIETLDVSNDGVLISQDWRMVVPAGARERR
ncbi:MAG: MaoC/PaaZ C-terminal domain-containing protein [Hyphomicrobiales bacterium]|nr:MaoC/PaaZ C-terminal domain-containing protein [Hyphomicrobiales bacterium]MCY4049631.1 MaoC/PaaZ C-terminal domain-containing protein [Hyphomicrobiales bacterium]MCY4052556.1 MaoC/PaaZ C-terminal domain-containing protein [Hyphomicrobiales bacterium]